MLEPLREIIQTAIEREIEAKKLYLDAVELVKKDHLRDLLRDLANQEEGHRLKLQSLLAGELEVWASPPRDRIDLKITDYLVETAISPLSDFQDIMILAGKREKASHDLYLALANASGPGQAAELFRFLAAEELAHKQRVEALYQDVVYDQDLGYGHTNVSSNTEEKEQMTMDKYECLVCGWIYDPAVGDPDNGVEPGTAFEDVPEDWVCPECGAGKDMFEKMA